MLQHVTHNYIIDFVEGLFPLASEAHCECPSLHEYAITIELVSLHYLGTVTQIEVFHVNTAVVLTNFVFTKTTILDKILNICNWVPYTFGNFLFGNKLCKTTMQTFLGYSKFAFN